MSEQAGRPRGVDRLMEDFASLVGIPGMAFDDRNICVIEYEELVLEIAFVGEEAGLVVRHPIPPGSLPPTDNALSMLLRANGHSAARGLGSVAFDTERGELAWFDRIALRGLTADGLLAALAWAARGAGLWRRELVRLVDDDRSRTADASAAAGGDGDMMLFRG
ncbi:type III secretion system chaperone [Prosthecomicrobium hirschii]|uniref:type III secretion system chaperone n=1 Tax=Prosthecodimorpha hirschii TaxID=665126 RepID=UPI00221E635C|nr:type III secretion system chaperone [Prosthecomicrobium hirschii]MCW1839740.1 type III secretion system chaperone [Prosthecomicrobium hirschii]